MRTEVRTEERMPYIVSCGAMKVDDGCLPTFSTTSAHHPTNLSHAVTPRYCNACIPYMVHFFLPVTPFFLHPPATESTSLCVLRELLRGAVSGPTMASLGSWDGVALSLENIDIILLL